MKILVADDDNVSRLVLASLLKRQGHEVIAAENGLKAWDTFQKDVFPVLILDWLMPEMDGLALCRKVRTLVRPVLWRVCGLERHSPGNLLTGCQKGGSYG